MRKPSRVFISYSHEDETWKDRLVKQLNVLAYDGGITIWDDRQIAAGDDWESRIEAALDQATVAVLLISADFLTSNFIRGVEIPRLLKRREAAGVRVIPLLVKPCPWEQVPWLSAMQIRPRGGTSLSGVSDHDADDALAKLASEIAAPHPAHQSEPPSRASARDAVVLAPKGPAPALEPGTRTDALVRASDAPEHRPAWPARRAAWLSVVALTCALAAYTAWRLARLSSASPPAAAARVGLMAGKGGDDAATPFATLEYSLALRRDAGADCNAGPAAQPVDSSRIFRAGDCLSIRLLPRRDGVLYVVNEGPRGAQGLPQFNLVFPEPGAGVAAAHMAPRRDVVVPWLRFDAEQGTELLWIVFSAAPIDILDTSVARRRVAGEIRDEAARRTLYRFLTAADPPREVRDGVHVTLASARDPLVHVLRLEHR